MRRVRALAALVLAVSGTALVVTAPPVDAVGPPAAAWWSRLATDDPGSEVPAALPVPAPTTPGTVPAGATVPDGHLLVEGGPEGATAVAAMRWRLATGESGPSLTLPIARGSTISPESTVLACRSATEWEPPEAAPGPWDSKPVVDGAACVNGIIAEDLSSISFGLQPLVSGDLLDVVLAPGRQPPVEVPPGAPEPPLDVDGSTFRLVLETPSADALQVVAGSGFEPGAGDRVVTPPPTPDADLYGPPPGPGPTELGSSPSAVDAPAAIPAPALAADDVATGAPDVTDVIPAAAGGPEANRTIGFLLLALAGAVWGWAALQPGTREPAEIGLGRFRTTLPPGNGAEAATPTVGGLSRFARARTSRPTPLG